MSKNDPSLFAATLREMLDPKCFSREEWAEIFWVTPSAISQWLTDRTVPRASTLRTIVDAVEKYCGHKAVEKFNQIASERADLVSPLGERMHPTVAHYMVTPIREGFLRLLGTLRPKHQEIVLFKAAEHCRILLDQEEAKKRLQQEPVRNPNEPDDNGPHCWDMTLKPAIAA